MRKPTTHYDALQIAETAPRELIEASWKTLMKRYHPDGSEPNAKKAVEINIAHDVLSDPNKREEYDRQIALARAARRPQVISETGTMPASHLNRAYPPSYPNAYPPNPYDLIEFALREGLEEVVQSVKNSIFDRLSGAIPIEPKRRSK